MGAYYAAGDGEPDDVVQALRGQYRIRLDAPVTAGALTAAVLFIAERAETLVGIWGIGLAPTGERAPFGLRRAPPGLTAGKASGRGRVGPTGDIPVEPVYLQ